MYDSNINIGDLYVEERHNGYTMSNEHIPVIGYIKGTYKEHSINERIFIVKILNTNEMGNCWFLRESDIIAMIEDGRVKIYKQHKFSKN